MDQLERATREGLRVAVTRRGTEYIVLARRIENSDMTKLSLARHFSGRPPLTYSLSSHLPEASEKREETP